MPAAMTLENTTGFNQFANKTASFHITSTMISFVEKQDGLLAAHLP